MFQVKATVVGYIGDEEKYPCHFQHKIGDEFIYDGEKYIGRICPHFSSTVVPKMVAMCATGPRKVPTHGYFYPFWYAPVSRKAPELKKFDGIGFRNVLETAVEPPRHIANMKPAHAFDWPPVTERTISLDNSTVACGDTRTSVVMKIEAFDLSDKGDATPYFRREMTILKKVLSKPEIRVDKILKEFTKKEVEEIYPALSPVMVQCLVEELELIGFLSIENGKAAVTGKGVKKLNAFKKSLSAEEKEALKM